MMHDREYICTCSLWDGIELNPEKELIRCKDCKYAKPWKGIDRDWIDCTADNKRLMKPEGFCSWAERREE